MSESSALLTIDDYEKAAKRVLPKMAYDYYRSGAEEERTLRNNRKAFKRYEVWYRVLVDVSEVDTATMVLGQRLGHPIIVAPTAYHRLAHPDGEIATAQGAEQAGALMVVSTLATTRLEDVATASRGPKWFQLYIHKDRGLTKELVQRAQESGYAALVLTVDAPVLGRRLDDERNSFALPEGMAMENFAEGLRGDTDGSALGAYVAERHDATVKWEDIEWLAGLSGLPLVLKGIVRTDDAQRAIDGGARAIIVSNHGGRQMDSAPASIDALAEISDLVGDGIELLMDGGVRNGVDALKALACGARAVLIGRPVLWGLAVAGAEGVASVIEIIRGGLEAAMKLSGSPDVASITGDLVRRRP